MTNGILYDSTLCIGCKACEQACAQRWSLPYNETIAAEEQISAHKLTAIQQHGDRFVRRICMHCKEPTCVSVCPVAALQKTREGPVIYDESRCMGCRYCMTACPFQVPVYEWTSTTPRVRKCDMCRQRQLAGRQTACAETCPTGATKFGERTALIAEAQQRIAEKPKDYYPRIYGVHEAGGTSVLILSAVPFEQLGLRTNLPSEPLPHLTWNVLSHVPDIGSVGSVLLGGIWWITHRREQVAREEGSERTS
ncbi:MAG TPA: 4Fe-4S dicluster domain-containing protein [Bryobacteraceae bacterium]|jgi:formate dehydrogenase iron-sulfur subunit|nr:4Fe-4S dicluster domain-containing protein [Bryobacteraceae bacterium]